MPILAWAIRSPESCSVTASPGNPRAGQICAVPFSLTVINDGIYSIINYTHRDRLEMRGKPVGESSMKTQHQTEAEAALAPYHPEIREIIDIAWRKWLVLRQMFPEIQAGSRANIVWDFMRTEALKFAECHDAIQPIEASQSLFLIIDDKVMIRFKKGEGQGLSRNLVLKGGQTYSYHDPQLNLFGTDLPRLEIVYVLSRVETKVAEILTVARQRDDILWAYEIPAVTPTATATPIPQATPDSLDSVVRAPKRGQSKEKRVE